ncbi:MAG TPA: AMP-binding protein, partial [Polyangiales bacterium]
MVADVRAADPPNFVPWHEQLARHARVCAAPWLILPKAPQRGIEHETISYRALFDLCERIRSALAGRGVGPGERALVVADNSAESLVFMLGALSAGVTIVPIAPPGLGQSSRCYQDLARRVVADCQPRISFARDALARQAAGVDAFDLAQLLAGSRAPARAPQTSAQDLAIIQYTSGTTGAARGVRITHANVFHNITSIGAAIGTVSGDVGASWLPTFHDMGLIGFLLAAFSGLSLVLLRPSSFYLRPEAWLWAIARFGAHYSMAPNAAYRLCAHKISTSRLQGLDLSRWRVAFNGADLIHPDSVHGFAQRFASHGFRAESMLPVYGLAENTLAATLPTPGRPPSVDWVDGASLEDGARTRSVDASARGAR